MKQRTLLTSSLALILTTSAFAQVPNRFMNGQVADADQVNGNFDYLEDRANTLLQRLERLEELLTDENIELLTEVLPHMDFVQLDNLDGTFSDAIRFDGVNVQIVNGTGATDAVNATGNLILGYAEPSTPLLGAMAARSGSHNLMLGRANSYTSYGGVVAGTGSAILAEGATVLAGQANAAAARDCVVVTGLNNRAEGEAAVVVGGSGNTTTGLYSAVLGGFRNVADLTQGTVVVGGSDNRASGGNSVVVGGRLNTASGDGASILGGRLNTAPFEGTSVGGGFQRSPIDSLDFVAGTLREDL